MTSQTDECGPLYPDADYIAFLEEGRFMIQRCRKSGEHFFYPRIAAPGTGETDLEWVEASGRGVVYSTTVVRKKDPEDSYNVALVDLDEGPRVMSRVIGVVPDSVKMGQPVQAEISQTNDGALLTFRISEN